ncbi:MAG: DUF6514 family protein [Bacillota bacterium]
MRELQMGTRLIQTESRDWLRLDYSVLIGDQESGVEQYGLKIARQNGIEAIAVENITFSAQRIFSLISLLMNHAVTPFGLEDVLDDWL